MQTHKRKRLRRKKEKSVRVVVLGICELERGQNCNYRGVHVHGRFGGQRVSQWHRREERGLFVSEKRREESETGCRLGEFGLAGYTIRSGPWWVAGRVDFLSYFYAYSFYLQIKILLVFL